MRSVCRVSIFLVVAAWTLDVQAVSFDWAVVGNPGNEGQVQSQGTFGGVDYVYRISKYEVTNAQYVEFLNAIASTDTYGLYTPAFESSFGGITRNGTPGNYTYSVKDDATGQGPGGSDYKYADKPVVFVSYIDTYRFVNWLENGQPTGAQGPGTTEDGVYAINDGFSEVRNPSATYFLPSEDEWYKAAYHKNDGVTGNYWLYPTSTDTVPDNNLPSADTGNSANFDDDGVTTGNPDYPLTDVGAYSLSPSPYGTFDQGGNVDEWNESSLEISSRHRVPRGGTWHDIYLGLPSTQRGRWLLPTNRTSSTGFRVASIPEPSSLILIALGVIAIVTTRRR